MEEALVARLRAAAAIAALVADRIDWGVRQHGETLPAIVLNVISPGRRYTHDGWDGLGAPRLQADCYGATYASAKLTGRALRDEMEASAEAGGIAFGPGFVDAEQDMGVTDLGGGVKVFRHRLDFLFTWASI